MPPLLKASSRSQAWTRGVGGKEEKLGSCEQGSPWRRERDIRPLTMMKRSFLESQELCQRTLFRLVSPRWEQGLSLNVQLKRPSHEFKGGLEGGDQDGWGCKPGAGQNETHEDTFPIH